MKTLIHSTYNMSEGILIYGFSFVFFIIMTVWFFFIIELFLEYTILQTEKKLFKNIKNGYRLSSSL